MSNLGLDKIIALAAPILSAFYPPLIVLVIFAVLDKWITSKYVGGVAAYTAFATSLLSVLNGFGLPFGFIGNLPFTKLAAWLGCTCTGWCCGRRHLFCY